jgi:hypothetical protein
MRGENGAEVPLPRPGYACCMGECLLRTDNHALRVKPFCRQQSDELAPSAANVGDASGCGRGQQGKDVRPVNKSSRLVLAAADVLCGVSLVETAP